MKMTKLSIIRSVLLVAALLAVPVSCVQKASHDHADHAARPASNTYADAIKQIRSRMTSLNSIIASGKYTMVHNDAEAIVKLCDSLEKLAAEPNSGVPHDKVQTVARQAKELATATEDMHDAAHAGEVPQLKEHYAHMIKLVDALAMFLRKP